MVYLISSIAVMALIVLWMVKTHKKKGRKLWEHMKKNSYMFVLVCLGAALFYGLSPHRQMMDPYYDLNSTVTDTIPPYVVTTEKWREEFRNDHLAKWWGEPAIDWKTSWTFYNMNDSTEFIIDDISSSEPDLKFTTETP